MRRKTNDRYEISGPGTEGRGAPDLGPAISLATNLAGRRDSPAGTWYVRDAQGTVVSYVERHDDTSLTINRGRRIEAA